MKKTVLCSVAALAVGLALGLAGGSGLLSPILTPAATATAVPPDTTMNAFVVAPAETPPPLDRQDNVPLMNRAGQVLEAVKAGDFTALSWLAHPEKGVTFTPYSTVSPECDLSFTPTQLMGLGQDDTLYTWGVQDGKGDPIRLTGAAYFERYVFNADYTQAPQVGVDTVLLSGNALENVKSAYPDGRFVEYHYPGLNPRMEGYDWCSLKLVFEVYQNEWYLVGLIHSEWTV